MDDHQINARLADIAGLETGVAEDGDGGWDLVVAIGGGWHDWSPLTDWSQLGPLVEKYVWDIERYATGEWCVWAKAVDKEGPEPDCAHIDLMRAICLSIIAAHEECVEDE